MKKINVQQAESIGIEFQDGKIKECKFTAYSMYILDTEFGGFNKVFDEVQEKVYSGGAKILYAGLKACDDSITFKDTKQIICNMTTDNILDIIAIASESVEVKDEKKLKQVNQRAKPQDFKRKKKH